MLNGQLSFGSNAWGKYEKSSLAEVGLYYDERRSNIKNSDGLVSAGTHNLLIARHKAYAGYSVLVSGECLGVSPFVLCIPYFHEQVRRGRCYSGGVRYMCNINFWGVWLAPNKLPLLSKSRSFTFLVWPFNVRSNSPVSQSQILTVKSSLADAIRLNVGWNATFVTASRCPVRVYAAGATGTQSVSDPARLVGALFSSSCSVAIVLSISFI